MKVSEKWLREWVNPAIDSARLSHQLTMAGLEVDAMEPAAPDFSQVVVGEVTQVQPHPDADQLSVCQVRTGESGETLAIVCGAPNVRENMRYPTALVGARLPGGVKIKRAKLRGMESQGMLCSAAELGLGEHAGGLMALPGDAPLGRDFREYLALDDTVFTLDLTPNRGDCLSIQGVAREISAINALPLRPPDVAPVPVRAEVRRPITVQARQECPHYVGRIVDGMDPRAQSPLWLRERLRRNGLRPVSAIVDVTNYVMLELGQPLHAFDDARLHGGVSIRMARADERLKVIAGETIALDEQCLVIADENAPIALAGVMGGAETAVNDATRRVFLESAYFTPLAVAGRGRQFKLHTDALHRFERGVYPNLQVKAIERASRLLLDMAGGEAGPLVEADHRPAGPAPAITLRRARIARLLGSAIPAPEIEAILQRLGFDCERMDDENWQVRPPGFRYDIAREADLVEEVARLHGFESLPARQRWAESRFIPVPETQTPPARLRQALVQRGYQEAITYSFSEPGLDAMLTPALPAVSVDNPIADTMSEMRTTLWSGLLTAWVYNLQRQQARIRLFEIGRTFHLEKNEIAQTMRLAGLAGGPALPEQWGAQARELDFYDMKGDVEALLVSAGKTPAHDLAFRAEAHPALHPGQSARIVLDGWPAGWCGRLQPQLARKLRAKGSCLLFELSLTALGNAVIPSYRQVPEYPSIRRDLALVVNDAVNAADLIECIQAVGVSTLVEAFPFDLYRGGSLQEGQKSIAFGLIFQDKYRTLKDDEVDAVVARIQARLAAELGADIRG